MSLCIDIKGESLAHSAHSEMTLSELSELDIILLYQILSLLTHSLIYTLRVYTGPWGAGGIPQG